MDITPGLPETDNFQHWPPGRPLVVETARRVLEYTAGTLVIPMTVLIPQCWQEIHSGLTHYGIPVRHFVLHAGQETLRRRIEGGIEMCPASFRLAHLPVCAQAARTWLHDEAQVIDTEGTPAEQVARTIADAVEASPHEGDTAR